MGNAFWLNENSGGGAVVVVAGEDEASLGAFSTRSNILLPKDTPGFFSGEIIMTSGVAADWVCATLLGWPKALAKVVFCCVEPESVCAALLVWPKTLEKGVFCCRFVDVDPFA